MNIPDELQLRSLYENRFQGDHAYRNKVWMLLCRKVWQQHIPPAASVLDLGCGYGQFINNISCGKKWAMDMNPASRDHLNPDVILLSQDCSTPWGLPDESLDVIFSSNFFEHLLDKRAVINTVREARRCLRPDGSLICMGPNIKYLNGRYWDFFDHHLPLTEVSLSECLVSCGMDVVKCTSRFLPFTMVRAVRFPVWVMEVYLKMPILWLVFGKQFLVIARKR